MNFSVEDLIGQFVLTKEKSYIPDNWSVYQRTHWWLAVHPSLPVIEVLGKNYSSLGYILGYPINLSGELISGPIHFPVDHTSTNCIMKLESSLYELGGRFAAMFITHDSERFYLDPSGSLSAVFSLNDPIVASTTALIARFEDCEENLELNKAFDIPNKDRWYPFGLTPRKKVDRLLPNHFLDLIKWKPIRHWPAGEIPEDGNIQKSVSGIAAIVKNNIAAVAKTHPVYMALTAGRDSRMLLACARENQEHIHFYTIKRADTRGVLDNGIASRIAKERGLKHITLNFEQATESELNGWLFRTGNCVAGRTWQNVRTLKKLDSNRVNLMGLAGEVGRGRYWWLDDTESTPINLEDLVRRINFHGNRIPFVDEVLSRVKLWLESLPLKNTLTILDILYIESRIGCWAMPQQYGHVDSKFRYAPFSHRKIFEYMLSIPYEYRYYKLNSRWVDLLIANQWPELLKIPFNQPIGSIKYKHGYYKGIEGLKRRKESLRNKIRSWVER